MPAYLETTLDKFTFRVATDRLYTPQGLWVQTQPNGSVQVGIDDYGQQHNGDIAFASTKPVGTKLEAGDSFAEIETIKVMIELPSPVSGTVVEVNLAIDLTPEVINQDCYDKGWLAVFETANWETDRGNLLEPSAYFQTMQNQLQEELKKQ